jgi:hypothetical protein
MNIAKATRIKRLTFFSKRLKRPKRPDLEIPVRQSFSIVWSRNCEFFDPNGFVFQCEIQKQPNLDFSYRGLRPSPSLKYDPHMESLRLDSWTPRWSKSPIFPNFEVNLKKIYPKFKIRRQRKKNYLVFQLACASKIAFAKTFKISTIKFDQKT